MRSPLLATVLAMSLALASACGGGNNSPTPTPAPSSTTASATAAQTSTAAKSPATTTATAAPSPSSTAPADGTVDPLGSGQVTPWTVKPAKEPFTGIATAKDLRMGVHPENGGWERIVFEFAGDAWPPGTVQYVDGANACASGQPIAGLTGKAILQVAFTSAQSHDDLGKPTLPGEIKGPGKTVLSGLRSCDFEGHLTYVFGLSVVEPFKVTTLSNPPRVVIDVKQ